MTATLHDRAYHAAKYGANLVVPATEIKQLLDERDHFALAAGRQLDRADDAVAEARELTEELDRARLSESLHLEAIATLDAVRQLLKTADHHQNAFIQTGHLRTALNAAALAEGGDPR